MRLTLAEAASLLGVSEERVYEWIEDEFPAQRIRGQYRINRTELLEWATAHSVNVSPRVFAQPPNGVVVPSVREALKSGGLLRGVAGRHAADVVTEIIRTLPLEEEADRNTLLEFVLARRDCGLTMLADHIAIPQVRVPAVLASDSSSVTLAFAAQPVALGETGQTANSIFFIVSPTVHAHLGMVAKLAACLTDPLFGGAVTRRAPAEELLAAASEAEDRL